MTFKQKILLTVLSLTALIFSASSEAAVSIKGKNLDNIDDIISTATDGGSASLKKYSPGIV